MFRSTDGAGLDRIVRSERPQVVATLLRDLGDLDAAEDATQEALMAAVSRWPIDGVPKAPAAWLITAARRRAIDRLRREKAFDQRLPELVRRADLAADDTNPELIDERLSLILGCCHPALAPEAQVALTLRIVAGLSTAQIARAFLVTESTMTRRITRAKNKIALANIPFRVDAETLPERLDVVCSVIYSIYTEGHETTTDSTVDSADVCAEAIWLAELLCELAPDQPEVRGLLALLHFSEARRPARTDLDRTAVLLIDQDRSRWSQDQIERGREQLALAHQKGRLGGYQLQAAIAALHCAAPSFEQTDWPRIVGLYDVLLSIRSNPIAALNRAAAVGHADGPTAGLDALDELDEEHGAVLAGYPYLHACRAQFLAAAGRPEPSADSLRRAIELTTNDGERRQLTNQLNTVTLGTGSGVTDWP